MTTRADVNRLSRAQAEVVRLARRDLVGLFGTMDLSNPARVRDALLEVVPLLVRTYGDIAAAAAAEWYEEVRADAVGGSFSARVSPGVDPGKVEGSTRWAAGHLFGDNPTETLSIMSGAMQRHIYYSGRDTVRRNVLHDPSKPRWGRVPTGATTCAFCSMMASRGFVYLTAEAAGEGNDYHNDCDCQEVVEFDAEQHHIEGYDPDEMYDRYMAARAASGEYPSTKDILSNMRAMFPDSFTDGHVAKAV